MAGASSKSNPPRPRKRVEAETSSLKRAKDGSAFTRCESCNKDVSVALIDMHSCSLDSKIRMNLEAQVVEKETQIKKSERLSKENRKRSSSPNASKERKSKKEKKSTDPNKPKRPLSAYFIFMEEFRKLYKEAHPDSKGVTAVTKEAGEKWKSMTDEEKKAYTDRAAELKAEYLKAMEKYNAGGDEGAYEKEGSDKEGDAGEEKGKESCEKDKELLEDEED